MALECKVTQPIICGLYTVNGGKHVHICIKCVNICKNE